MPAFELKEPEELKRWLIEELTPISDAEPPVLTDYVMALLQNESSEVGLQDTLQSNLDDFLAEHTEAFVRKTIDALKTQSYLPQSKKAVVASTSSAAGTSRKRSADDEGRGSPPKASRDHDVNQERQFRERRDGASGSSSRHKPPCRDFHQRGFCARGDSCKFDHTLPPNAMMNGGMTGQAMMQMPIQAPFPGMQAPPGAQAGMWQQPQNGQEQQQQIGFVNGGGLQQGPPQGNFSRGGFSAGHRGGQRGGRGGARGTFERRPTSDTTLVVENIPADNLDLVKINEYFKKFGTITNIQIDVDNSKALVSFSQPAEAKAAHTSPEVIFNNRFVKVYFQKLDDAFHKPKEVTPAPAPPKQTFTSNFVPGQNKFVRPNLAQEKAKGAQEAQQAAQKRLDDLLAEQKATMASLTTGSPSAEEKKELMTKFASLDGDIKAATEQLRLAVEAKNSASTPASSLTSTDVREQKEQREREQLDRELEALNGGAAPSSESGQTTEELKATLARLQAEATELGIDPENAQADLNGGLRGGFHGRGRGVPFRAGFAARGYSSSFRGGGRGAAMGGRASMTLDNRPSRLVVASSSVGDGISFSDPNKVEKVKAFFLQFGELHDVEAKEDGTVIVNYKARSSGERALRSVLDVPDVGLVKATWEGATTATQGATNGKDAGAASAVGDGENEGDDEDREEHFRR